MDNENIYIFNLYASTWNKYNFSINNYVPNSLVDKFHKMLKPSFHLLLPTIGRRTIFRMLNSLKYQLDSCDSLTIIYDGIQYTTNLNEVKIYTKDFKCKINIIVNNENLGYYGHAIRNKYNKFQEDFVFHIDDDDHLVPNIMTHIRNTCVCKNTIYLYKCIWGNQQQMWNKPEIKLSNISTQCGIIPSQFNDKAIWELIIGGDFEFYNQLCNKYNHIFVDKIHYIMRDCNYNIK